MPSGAAQEGGFAIGTNGAGGCLAIIGNKLYVSAYSIAPASGLFGNPAWTGQIWRPHIASQALRISCIFHAPSNTPWHRARTIGTTWRLGTAHFGALLGGGRLRTSASA